MKWQREKLLARLRAGRAVLQRLLAALGMMLAATPLAAQVYSDVSSEASLVALWQLNEAFGSPTVSATNGNPAFNGAVFGGTTLGVPSAMTTLGTAAGFNGSTGKIDVPFNAALNPASYTIEAWAQVAGGTGVFRSPLTSRAIPGGATQGYIFYASSGNNWENWNGNGTGGWSVQTGPAATIGQWVHLAGTFAGGTKVFYLNGQPVVTTPGTVYVPNASSPLRIGAGATEGAGSFFFNGPVDNVAVMNSALAHQSISDHYNAKSNYANRVALDNPVAHWRLGEQAGASAYNARNVTAYVGTYSSATLRQQATGLANDIDTAAAFTGAATSRVSVPYSPALNPSGSFSIEAWARPNAAAGGAFHSVLTSRSTGDGTEGFIFYQANDNTWQFWNGTGLGSWHTSNGPTVSTTNWTHLVGTYDADTMTKSFYVNGVLFDQDLGVAYRRNDVSNLFIGAGGDAGTEFFFNGLVDEVAVYNFALSSVAVSDHYQTGITGQFLVTPEPAALAIWSVLGAALAAAAWQRGRKR